MAVKVPHTRLINNIVLPKRLIEHTFPNSGLKFKAAVPSILLFFTRCELTMASGGA